MILSAGLTPAWQQIMLFRGFRYGEVNRAEEVHWHAQGKVINAGIAAHFLGGPSLTLAPLGGPPLEQIDRELADLGVPRRWIVTRATTRVCTTLLDRVTGEMTELVENGRPLTPEELDDFRRAYAEEAAKASVAVLTGSLPAGTPDRFYRELVERTPCPAVLDFRGPGLLATLDCQPLVVKPNREELSQTVNRSLDDDHQLVDAMRSLNARGAQWVVVTQGGGPVWITSASEIYRLHPPKPAQIVNPIGSGDALAAATAWAIRGGRPVVEAVRVGIAAAVDNLVRLDTCRLDREGVLEMANTVVVERVG
ncbi:MAG: PfkB family carbohydrate kinase [Planctomycetaceae bacterium]|nr:PfkB family carbohydrate kinase [Planctomycetaceae bacterium]